MSTLDDLLALLPDNSTGDISAADLRAVVTGVWNAGADVEARVVALETAGGTVSVTGVWRVRSDTGGAVPTGGEVTSDTGNFATATWLRFDDADDNGQDLTTALLAASTLYGQDYKDSANFVRYLVTDAVDLGDFVELAVTVDTADGVLSPGWTDAVFVITTGAP